MDYKDEKKDLTKDTLESQNEGSKISDDAADALKNGTFDEKEKKTDKPEKDGENSDDAKEAVKKKKKSPLSSRKFKKGSFAIVLTCLVIVAVIVINIIVNVLQAKVPALSVDMTGQNLYELSDGSKELVRSVDKDVTISVMAKEDVYTQSDENFLKANALLKKYAAENDKIKIEYVDLQANPTYVNKYPEESITECSYIVSCGDKYKYLSVAGDLFTVGTDSATGSNYVKESNVESAVTSAIYFVTSDNQTKVALLGGFGDAQTNASTLITALKANNYEVEDVNLLTSDIPKDCDMAVLFMPTADLTEEAAKRVTDYLSNDGEYGKNLFYVPVNTKLEQPNTDSILEEWGMSLGQGLIAETDSSHRPSSYDYYFSVFDYTASQYVSGLDDTTKYLLGAYTRPVMIEDSSTASSLATTSDKAALRSFDADENWDPTQHIEGVFNVGAVGTKTVDGNSSTLTVWGSAYSFYPSLFNSSATYVNYEYFVNLFNILTDRQDNPISIESKNLQSTQLGIMSDQINIIAPLFTYVVPICVLAVGLIIWIRRRHR